MQDFIIAELRRIAREAAESEGARVATLADEIDALEDRLVELKADQDRAKTAVMRGESFARAIIGTFECPMCWVFQGAHVELRTIPSNDISRHSFRCENCNREFWFLIP